MLDTVKTKNINGIDLERLGEIVQAIETDMSQAQLAFQVKTSWAGGTRSESVVDHLYHGDRRYARSHRIVADEPSELGGGDTGPNPQELLLSAFNACITVGYVAGAALRGITLRSVEIETNAELDLRGFFGMSDAVPPGSEQIDYVVKIDGDASPDVFREIHEQVMKTSPNYFNLSRPVRMNGRLSVA